MIEILEIQYSSYIINRKQKKPIKLLISQTRIPMIKSLKNGKYQYEEKDFAGQGAFARVYKGVITQTQKVIAVRILPLNLIKKFGSKIKEIINGEANVLRELAQNTDPDRMFTTKIYDCFLTQNNVTMIFEFCQDGNLGQIIQKRGALPQFQALEIVYQLARGIQYIAKNSVVHRDLKPDNIFLKRQGTNMLYKLGDFGFAVKKQINDQVVGTPVFMSPQIFRQQEYGSQVDVWAFGLLVHYILFNQYYFIAKSQSEIKKRVLKEQYQLKNHHRKLISKQMADFLTQCLKFDKKNRTKATQISMHPVFNKLRPKVEIMMQQVLKTSQIADSKIKSIGSKGRIIKFLTSFNFIFDLASKLSTINQYNLASLYLHKFNYTQLTSIYKQLNNQQNILNIKDWKQFVKSSDYKQVLTYSQRIYQLNKKSFQDSYNTVMKTVAHRYSPQVAKGIQKNLGHGPQDKMRPQIIVYEMSSNIIPGLRKNNSPQNYCLILECMLVKYLTQRKNVDLDFTYLQINKKKLDPKQKADLYQQALSKLK